MQRHPLVRTVVLHNSPNQNITINLDMASSPSTNGGLGEAGSARFADDSQTASPSNPHPATSATIPAQLARRPSTATARRGPPAAAFTSATTATERSRLPTAAAFQLQGITYVGVDASSTAAVNFGASGGTLTTGTLFASPTQLTGTGTINTHGLISDLDLVFDATHGLTQTITLGGLPNQNVAINLALRGSSNPPGDLPATGWQRAAP